MRKRSLNTPLSEKARPAKMNEVIGQEEGIRALRAAMCGPNPQHVIIYGPPGCGKTHILASRVRWAHSHGVGFEDMLCLTFTNRAARGMINRIGEVMDGEDLGPLHVGNVHHFCSRFLFEQQVVPADSSIVSDCLLYTSDAADD